MHNLITPNIRTELVRFSLATLRPGFWKSGFIVGQQFLFEVITVPHIAFLFFVNPGLVAYVSCMGPAPRPSGTIKDGGNAQASYKVS